MTAPKVANAANTMRLASRKASTVTTQLKLVLRSPVHVFAIVKHVASILVSFTFLAFYATSSTANARSLHTYAPEVMIATTAGFAVLHMYGLSRIWRVVGPRNTWFQVWRHPNFNSLAGPLQLTLFHFADVSCQSYQAYHASQYIVDSASAFGFSVVVSLNCLVTPWFLLTKHKYVQRSLVPLLQSIFGFLLSTIFQIYVLIAPALYYLFAYAHQNDDKFNIRLLLLSRWMVVSSPLDLVTKVAIQLFSYSALRKLVDSVNVPHLTMQSMSPLGPVSQHFYLEFHHHRSQILYAVFASIWGGSLLYVSFAANWRRQTCPATCIYQLAPWWSSECACAYVEINCASKNTSGDSIDSFLLPHELGTRVMCINVRRCALPQGIPMVTLAPFQDLYALYISFSNMTGWSSDPNSAITLPDSLTSLRIRYSNLTSVPTLLARVPPNLVYLRLEGAPITTIPDAYFHAWANVPSIILNDINLTEIPQTLAARTATLEWLELRGNGIRSLPTQWSDQVDHLQYLDLSANALTEGPWGLVKSRRLLELSSNPIAAIPISVDPRLLKSRIIIMDNTPFCASSPGFSNLCKPKCASMCGSAQIGDGSCDWSCYSVECQFDGGDCVSFGFP
ncbi:Aste57867_3078 [Aphanomyces stellatus]|uniref:Aste57867_3078 protein n=1 Tax=Aphanomyces stellatus TaxID=120398 RepID=A0A485KBF1_9STRA|nr:hypothetical protein As57867_003069 [Aphanomyces stellatus]VFT80257.1 Aste57867_3078 [Aphanomyces stellatus]